MFIYESKHCQILFAILYLLKGHKLQILSIAAHIALLLAVYKVFS